MDPTKKWTIEGSGIVFEDKLFQGLVGNKILETSTLACFLVTLPNEQDKRLLHACFGSDTEKILKEVTPTIEDLSSDMSSFIEQFKDKDQKQINALLAQYYQLDGPLPVKSYWLDWLDICLKKYFLTSPSLQSTDWSEHWYSVNFWGLILDTIFQQIEGATVHR